jgi:hypothetical protein
MSDQGRTIMHELVYTSAARRVMNPSELGAILEHARTNNARLSVSGILLYERGSFIQVLEGDEATVTALFAKIAADPRHDRVHVLTRRTIERASFARWSMGFVSLDQQVMRDFPLRHALSSNGSLHDQSSAVIEILDAFRSGRFRSYVLG